MSLYTEFFLNCGASIAQYECIALAHPNFSKTYYVTRNGPDGLVVTHEDGKQYTYSYYPMKVEKGEQRNNLDYSLKITLGDLGEILPLELDRLRTATDGVNGFLIKPTVTYRAFRSDMLDTVLYGPVLLQTSAFANTPEGCAFVASAPALNLNETGETYTIDRFVTLQGFL